MIDLHGEPDQKEKLQCAADEASASPTPGVEHQLWLNKITAFNIGKKSIGPGQTCLGYGS
jgi:hypothetical protein